MTQLETFYLDDSVRRAADVHSGLELEGGSTSGKGTWATRMFTADVANSKGGSKSSFGQSIILNGKVSPSRQDQTVSDIDWQLHELMGNSSSMSEVVSTDAVSRRRNGVGIAVPHSLQGIKLTAGLQEGGKREC